MIRKSTPSVMKKLMPLFQSINKMIKRLKPETRLKASEVVTKTPAPNKSDSLGWKKAPSERIGNLTNM